ncbi:DUF3006 domain-containing protein [Desulfallas sp. Bu1-1]|nr:DUF3006 domain-containing protein [Desulfallas sp. Bu1-1]
MIIINRFEENWAVVEYGHLTFNLPRELLPREAREGDVLNIVISVDNQTMPEYDEDIDTLINEDFKKD